MVGSAPRRVCAALTLAALSLILPACPSSKPKLADMSAEDLAMLRGAQLISDAIRAYQRDTAELPGAIRDAEPYLLRGETWPVNPYTKQPMEEVGSAEFDPAASVGKLHYEKFARDGVVVNYRLHVFGATRKLTILDNTPSTLR